LINKQTQYVHLLITINNMKRFTKIIAAGLGSLALFLATTVKAQTTQSSAWSLGIGLEAGIPTGNASDISSFEIGGTARLQYGASKSIAIMLTSGYYNMIGKTVANGSGLKYPSLGMVPLKIGGKAYVAPNFYIDGEAGAGFDTSYENHTKLILSPGIGYDAKTWDVGLRYENYSGQNNSFGLLGLRIAYDFGL
jgi:hypothetical protein